MIFDYYTVIVAEEEKELLDIHLNSLNHFCPDSFQIRISTCLDLISKGDRYFFQEQPYVQKAEVNVNLAGYDFCHRIHNLINLGMAPWFVVAHADIAYTSSLVKAISGLMRENTGMIGHFQHGLTVINRDVYNKCHLGFWPLANIFIESDMNLSGYKTHTSGARMVSSPDISLLLYLEIQGLGFDFENASLLGPVYFHPGEQSGHSLKVVSQDQLQEAKNRIASKRAEFLGKFNQFRSSNG
jgi:hypothetical protein